MQKYSQNEANEKFQLACMKKDLEQVRYWLTSNELEYKANIHNDDDLGFLFACCNDSDVEVIKYLLTSPELSEHANIHANDNGGLYNACRYGQLEVVKFLLTSNELKENLQVDAAEALKQLCNHGYMNILQYLVNEPINMDMKGLEEQGLRLAINSGNLEMVKFLTSEVKNPQNIHYQDNLFFIMGFEKGHMNIVNYYLYDLNLKITPQLEKKIKSRIANPDQLLALFNEIEKRDLFLKMNQDLSETLSFKSKKI